MDQRALTLRRFGPMSFGLGYYEDDVWIDHSQSGPGALPAVGLASEADRAALAAIHTWFPCCAEGAAEKALAEAGSARRRRLTAVARSATS